MAIDIGTARKRARVQCRMQRAPLPGQAMYAVLPCVVVPGGGVPMNLDYHWKNRSLSEALLVISAPRGDYSPLLLRTSGGKRGTSAHGGRYEQ